MEKTVDTYIKKKKEEVDYKLYPYICTPPIFNMMYTLLCKKHKNSCLYNFFKYKQMYFVNGKLKYSNKFFKSYLKTLFFKCKNKNLILILPFILKSKNNEEHFNLIVLNSLRGEIERFEPHGKSTYVTGINSVEVDKAIRAFSKYMEPNYKYISPSKMYQNLKGFQYFDDENKRMTDKNSSVKDPKGYCCAWAFFYADIRLKFPKCDSNFLIRRARYLLGRSPRAYRNFIRSQNKTLLKVFKDLNFSLETYADLFYKYKKIHDKKKEKIYFREMMNKMEKHIVKAFMKKNQHQILMRALS